MDNCPQCNSILRIAKSRLEPDKNNIDIYNVMEMQCVNPNCENYNKLITTIKNKAN